MRVHDRHGTLLYVTCLLGSIFGTFVRGFDGVAVGEHDGHSGANSENPQGNYMGEYAVHIRGGPLLAQQVARELGYTFHGQVFEK